MIVSVPKALKRFSTARVEPLPIEVRATTAATPMTMPRMVSTARSGLARRLAKAMRSDSRTTIIGRRRAGAPLKEPPEEERRKLPPPKPPRPPKPPVVVLDELDAELLYVPVTTTSPAGGRS